MTDCCVTCRYINDTWDSTAKLSYSCKYYTQLTDTDNIDCYLEIFSCHCNNTMHLETLMKYACLPDGIHNIIAVYLKLISLSHHNSIAQNFHSTRGEATFISYMKLYGVVIYNSLQSLEAVIFILSIIYCCGLHNTYWIYIVIWSQYMPSNSKSRFTVITLLK